MNCAVDLHYGEGGIDHVKLMEAFGCPARRVGHSGEQCHAVSPGQLAWVRATGWRPMAWSTAVRSASVAVAVEVSSRAAR